MIQVVFICLGKAEEGFIILKMFFVGNICRSPLAEVVFSHVLSQEQHDLVSMNWKPFYWLPKEIHVSSAATSAYEIGNPADERAQQVALSRNLHSIQQHRARRLHPTLFLAEADEIVLICMDENNKHDTQTFLQKHPHLLNRTRLHLFSDFGGETGVEVIDPYYGDLEDFQSVLLQCERYSRELLGRLRQR